MSLLALEQMATSESTTQQLQIIFAHYGNFIHRVVSLFLFYNPEHFTFINAAVNVYIIYTRWILDTYIRPCIYQHPHNVKVFRRFGKVSKYGI